MASSAIPGFFSPSPIGAQLFVDGGVLENTPLNPAIDAGADALHVIYLDPDVDKIPIQYLSNLLSVMYRVLVINWADKINQSVRLARLINEIITRLSGDPNVTEVAEAFKKHLGLKTSLRRLIIHLYHPRHELGGPFSLLDFRHETIDGLIEAGFNDAARHNCANNGCLVE
jgi:predicted acylesterase/phospholipase RssA